MSTVLLTNRIASKTDPLCCGESPIIGKRGEGD
jgi:hypothetical protein